MSLIPKETRYPYCDTSLLTHSLTVATLTVALANCLKELKNRKDGKLCVTTVFTDFSNFLLHVYRLPVHKAKLKRIDEFHQDFSNKVNNEKLFYNMVLPSTLPKFVHFYGEKNKEILALIKNSTLNPLIWIGSETEIKKFNRLVRVLVKTLEESSLHDVCDFYIAKADSIKIGSKTSEKITGILLNRNLFRRKLRKIWKKGYFMKFIIH